MMEDRAGASGTADVDEYQVQRVLVPGVRMRNSSPKNPAIVLFVIAHRYA